MPNSNLPISDKSLLDTAFTHRSHLNESKSSQTQNERLEFLGDAVLELAVSKHLYHLYPKKPEGELTSLRASLVKTTTLAQVASKLNFGSQLKMSKGEHQTGGRENTGILADTFEAVIGAIYLDKGFDAVNQFLSDHLYPLLPNIIKNNLHKDFKSTFQERVQSQGHPTPTYQLSSSQGPDHQKIFKMTLKVGDKTIASGSGKNKQAAQQQAAQKGLALLDGDLKL